MLGRTNFSNLNRPPKIKIGSVIPTKKNNNERGERHRDTSTKEEALQKDAGHCPLEITAAFLLLSLAFLWPLPFLL